MSAAQAVALLGVKRATLYSYVGRGWVRRFPNPEGAGNLYSREDLARLKQRHDARSGHGPVAAGAMFHGEPVLETAICRVGPEGPVYRGKSAVGLAASGATFEEVCDWLWDAPQMPPLPRSPAPASRMAEGRVSAFCAMLTAAARAASQDGLEDPRRVVKLLAAAPLLARRSFPTPSELERLGVASTFALALDADGRAPPGLAKSLNSALILCADHELTASTFVARIAASTGATLWACLTAGLATLSGPRRGGAPALVSAYAAQMRAPSDAVRLVRESLRSRQAIPGFGHPLYRDGDPRAMALIALARLGARSRSVLARFEALATAVADATREQPSLDFGLAAFAAAQGLAPEAGTAIFALGRCAGMIAHVFEQRRDGRLLRPRAKYVGD